MANESRGRGEGSLSLTRPFLEPARSLCVALSECTVFPESMRLSPLAVCDTRCMVVAVHGITLYVMP